MLVKSYGSAIVGIDAMTITVEVAVAPGVAYTIVGLPDSAVKESLFRMASAFEQSGYKKPFSEVGIEVINEPWFQKKGNFLGRRKLYLQVSVQSVNNSPLILDYNRIYRRLRHVFITDVYSGTELDVPGVWDQLGQRIVVIEQYLISLELKRIQVR